MKEMQFTKEMFHQKIAEGWFFVDEKLLPQYPTDWIEAIGYILHLQQSKDADPFVIIFDESASEKMLELAQKDEIKLLVYNKDKNFIWECGLIKGDNNEVFFLGGENLRKFCDRNNIFYESHFATNEDGKELLMSFSTLKYLKNDDEDCRKPLDKEEVERRIKNFKKSQNKKNKKKV